MLIIVVFAPVHECPEDKYLNRHVLPEIAAACAYQSDVWRELGIELLGQDGIAQLDVIKASNSDDVTKCCSAMLTLWRQRQTDASWNQLIVALKQLKLNRLAIEIEKLLKSPTGQGGKLAGPMQAMKVVSTQQQDRQRKDSFQEKAIKSMLTI